MRLVTPRLILREYAVSDLDALRAYQADPRLREHYGPDEGLPHQISDLLHTFLGWAAEEPRRNWQLGIALRTGSCPLVGSCGLRQRGMQPGHVEFGLDLAPAYWGRGYGSETAVALLDFGFRDLGVVVVNGQTVSANARVARLVSRLGFRRARTSDGTEWMKVRGWRYDEWELTAEAWRAARSTAALPPGR